MLTRNIEIFLFLLFISLIVGILTAFSTALIRLGKFHAKEYIKVKKSHFFFFFFLNKFFKKNEWENIYFIIGFTKHILNLLYAIISFLFLLSIFPTLQKTIFKAMPSYDVLSVFFLSLIIIGFSILIDFIMRLIATLKTRQILLSTSPIASIILIIFFPLTGLFLKLARFFYKNKEVDYPNTIFMAKNKVLEMIKDSGLNQVLNKQDQKVITSFIAFREKVAREIMIPRVDLFSLPAEITVEVAAKKILQDDYSRVPIYKNTLDNICGVLMYKDLLKIYTQQKDLLQTPIENLAKPVIYAPENKKISQLFQEFKTRQTHLAIIVNEYGGTEGIVTIEDILEEIFGDIEDEYDIDEEKQFWKLPGGSWIVDAKMPIVDIESKLDIHIPPSPEYETIGGYIFHKAGTIPSKGWKINQDEFELEVLVSNERSIEKIRITPRIISN